MKPKTRLLLGSILGIVGCLAIILGPMFKLTEFPSPWSFIIGFFAGLSAGLGTALSISGLISMRK